MNPFYRRDKDHNYMVLEAPDTIQGTEYPVKMLESNEIPHLLKCEMRMLDGVPVFLYEITGMQPLYRVFEKTAMREEEIRALLSGIKAALEHTERFLLDGNQLLFEPEYLFLDVRTREVYMCYLPAWEGNMEESFRRLAEYILRKLDHSEEAAVMLGYDVYNGTAEENYSLSEVLQLVYKARKTEPEKQNGMDGTESDEADAEMAEELFEMEEELPESGKEPEGYVRENAAGTPHTVRRMYQDEKTGEARGRSTEKKAGEARGRGTEKKAGEARGRGTEKKAGTVRGMGAVLCVSGMAGILAVFLIFLVQRGILGMVQAAGCLFAATGIGIYALPLWNKKAEERQAEKEESGKKESHRWGGSRKTNGRNTERQRTAAEETCVLEREEQAAGILYSEKPEQYENWILSEGEMLLGKAKEKVDFWIPSPVVSRVHAKVIWKEGACYLMDLHSTNGTFVNGKRIVPEELVRLEQGDHITFASAEYYFAIE